MVPIRDNCAALSPRDTVAVIGAGTMGSGIAQVAAAAGHRVLLYDAKAEAGPAAMSGLAKGLQKQVDRGRMTHDDMRALIERITIAPDIESLSPARLVIEAAAERLEIKQQIFAQLEAVIAPDAILTSNTSSISITAIAACLEHPQRLAGLHFFNPAPVMRLVEVVTGLATASDVTTCLAETARRWGKMPVIARSTPGFIVNRVARAYYGEALRLAEEGVADPATLDALMTGGGGFRMGPFALMDLIGNDVNFAVSQSVFSAYFCEPRFRPSILQQEMVAAGWLGRKSGRGFFDHTPGSVPPVPATRIPVGDAWEDLVPGQAFETDAVMILPCDGRTAAQHEADLGCPVIVFDLCEGQEGARRMGYATSASLLPEAEGRFVSSLAANGIAATRLPDIPGLVVLRILSLIVNEAFEAMLQDVASAEDIDTAMRYGVNYPKGPVGWANEIGLARILTVLDHLARHTGDMRYRASVGLRRVAE